MDSESSQIQPELPQNPNPPQQNRHIFRLIFLVTLSLLIVTSIVYGAYLLGKNQNISNRQIAQTDANNPIPSPEPTLVLPTPTLASQKKFTNTILFSQVKYDEHGKKDPYLELYSIDPVNLTALLIKEIKIPDSNSGLASGPYNAYGANESVQWSEDGTKTVFRVEKAPGPGTDPPYFTSFYSSDPESEKTELLYKTENTVSPSWLLDSDGKNIYFLEGDKKIENADNTTRYHFVHLDVTGRSITDVSLPLELKIYDSDEFIWSLDHKSIIWAGKESKNYNLYSYNLETKQLSKEGLQAADTTYGPVSWNLSNNQKKYATSGFFGQEILIYTIESKQVDKIPVGVKINNARKWWGDQDKYILVTARKDSPSYPSSPYTDLRVVDLADKSNIILMTNEGTNVFPGPYPYKLTKFGYLIEYDNELYLYQNEKVDKISGITLTDSTAGIKDF